MNSMTAPAATSSHTLIRHGGGMPSRAAGAVSGLCDSRVEGAAEIGTAASPAIRYPETCPSGWVVVADPAADGLLAVALSAPVAAPEGVPSAGGPTGIGAGATDSLPRPGCVEFTADDCGAPPP
jgi:hypothetical protein